MDLKAYFLKKHKELVAQAGEFHRKIVKKSPHGLPYLLPGPTRTKLFKQFDGYIYKIIDLHDSMKQYNLYYSWADRKVLDIKNENKKFKI